VNGFGAVVTATATVIFLISKFAEGAWVVVVAVPTFVFLFMRIHVYYLRAAQDLGVGTVPAHPYGKRTFVIVPVINVSRLTRLAISEALSIGQEVIAISVVIDQGDEGERAAAELRRAWNEWDPGVALKILHTEYSSIVDPIVAFIDEARAQSDQQIVVLIPVVVPEHLRYRILHNQIDVVLSAALRTRTDIVVARVPMPLLVPSEDEAVEGAAPIEDGQAAAADAPDRLGTAPLSESPQ
jgi:hypothetical protein